MLSISIKASKTKDSAERKSHTQIDYILWRFNHQLLAPGVESVDIFIWIWDALADIELQSKNDIFKIN